MQSKIEGLRLGADAYIEKPFSMELLKANVTNLIHSRELLKSAFANSPFTSLNTVAQTKADEEFLKRLDGIIQANYQDPEFSMDSIAEKMNMSRSSFYRKIKGVIDLSPNDYLRIERLKKASLLLKKNAHQVNEICYMVGFSSPSYFSKCFLKQFGVLPKDFVK
jgi:AraC-like DNA-binding protein